ncbi:TcpQ domain-containing protein [Comamonas testosteroni]|uniref:TcpQ domain-containing protein n=1 Tax=Comamonas testosteroni TaxID=285 RepID=UPI0005B4AD8C|nr:TcpQ domain-containing protein [Comamonas testosteroni]
MIAKIIVGLVAVLGTSSWAIEVVNKPYKKPAAPTLTLPIGNSQPAAAAAPIAGVTSAVTTVGVQSVQKKWIVNAADSSARKTLDQWSKEANWDLVWNASNDVVIEANAEFSGDFPTAVTKLLDAISGADVKLVGAIYTDNNVLVVTEIGKRKQ